MNPHVGHNRQKHDHRIDEVLRRLGSVIPAPGIESRVNARLARERSKIQAAKASPVLFFGIPRLAIGSAVGALACVAIVVGTVIHSHRIQPALPGIVAQPSSSNPGMGSAGAERPADRPVSPSPNGRPRSVRHLSQGRAVISPQSQKPAGVAVPKTPSPDQ